MSRPSDGPYWPMATERPWQECRWRRDDGSRSDPHGSPLFDVAPAEASQYTRAWAARDTMAVARWLLKHDAVYQRLCAQVSREEADSSVLTARAAVVKDVLELRLATLFVGRRLVELLRRHPDAIADVALDLQEHPLRVAFMATERPSPS